MSNIGFCDEVNGKYNFYSLLLRNFVKKVYVICIRFKNDLLFWEKCFFVMLFFN